MLNLLVQIDINDLNPKYYTKETNGGLNDFVKLFYYQRLLK